jgi:hypothetical protein
MSTRFSSTLTSDKSSDGFEDAVVRPAAQSLFTVQVYDGEDTIQIPELNIVDNNLPSSMIFEAHRIVLAPLGPAI